MRTNDQRSESRVPIIHRGTLGADARFPCMLRDISSHGFLISCVPKFRIGDTLDLECALCPQKFLHCTVKVQHTRDDCLGAKIVEVSKAGQVLCRQFIAEYLLAKSGTWAHVLKLVHELENLIAHSTDSMVPDPRQNTDGRGSPQEIRNHLAHALKGVIAELEETAFASWLRRLLRGLDSREWIDHYYQFSLLELCESDLSWTTLEKEIYAKDNEIWACAIQAPAMH